MPDSFDESMNRDPDEAAKTAIIRQYWHHCARWAEGNADIQRYQAEIAKIEASQQQIVQLLNDCLAAGRLFGFDVILESQRRIDERNRQQESFGVIEAPIAPPPIPPPAPYRPRVKDRVLEYVELAYPRSAKATEIRQYLADQGVVVHEKTVGMTLTRWQAKGRVRCEGWNWFYVPQHNGQAAHPDASDASILTQTEGEEAAVGLFD